MENFIFFKLGPNILFENGIKCFGSSVFGPNKLKDIRTNGVCFNHHDNYKNITSGWLVYHSDISLTVVYYSTAKILRPTL